MSAAGGTQTVLITGATDGLGKAAALLLAERGYRVFAAGRSADKRAQLDALAKEKHLLLETMQMDVCDDASVQKAVASVYQKAGALDVLINNAGFVQVGAVEDLRLEDWRRQFETNFFGVIRVTQAVLPRMRERRKGRILMMSSVSGFVTPPTQGAYSASKHAIEALSNALRHELYPFGIHSILIQPGDRAHHQDAAFAALTHTGKNGLGHADHAKEIRFQLPAPVFQAEILDGTDLDKSRIVDQHVERACLLINGSDGLLH